MSHLSRDELERLDTLVSEYLLFRSYKQTQHQLFLDKRSPIKQSNIAERNQRTTIQRFLNALDGGDYPRMLTLWDTYISSKIGTVKSTALNAESRDAEFMVNLCCAIYPFRAEVIERAGSSVVAAKVAARSMTIFNHFLKTRGARLVQQGQEFVAYRNLHKIPFPPQHPHFAHLFTSEWYSETRNRVINFLEKFFAPEDEPVLCSLYTRIGSRSEDELKEVFRRRERKLLRFSRSLFSLSNDLLCALEDGKEVNKGFLVSFRQKFDSFQEVLQPDAVFDQDMGILQGGSPGLHGNGNVNAVDNEPVGVRSQQQGDWSSIGTKSRQRFDGKLLDYNAISRDIAFLLHQVGASIDNILTKGRGISTGDAVVYCHTAMQGTVLLQAMVHSILRPDKEFQTDAALNMAVLVLCRSDVLGLRQSVEGEASIADAGDLVDVESRTASKFLFFLARVAKQIPPFDQRRRGHHTDKGESEDEDDTEYDNYEVSDNEEGPESSQRQRLPAYERLLTAGELVAEYLCRVVVAMGCSKPGQLYLSSSGVHLTIALTQLLGALPLPDFAGTSSIDIYALGGEDEDGNIPVRPRSGNGICSWVIMALVTLVSDTKSHQLAVIKNGGIRWLATALGHFVSDVYTEIREDEGCFPSSLKPYPSTGSEPTGADGRRPLNSSLFEMCLSLLSILLSSEDAQRSLVSTNVMQRETEGLTGALLLLCMKPGIKEDHAMVLVNTLKRLLREVTTKDAVKTTNEATLLKRAVDESAIMSIPESEAKALLTILDSEDAYEGADIGGVAFNSGEIMGSIRTVQTQLSENIILDRYINGAISGLGFLMRYSRKDGAPRPLFDERYEPEERFFNETQVALESPRAPFKPKGKKPKPPPELKSRPRILRTPDGSSIPNKDDHGLEMDGEEEEEEDDIPDINALGEDGDDDERDDEGDDDDGEEDDDDEDEEEDEDD